MYRSVIASDLVLDRRGVSSADYVVVVALIAIGVIGGWRLLSPQLSEETSQASAAIGIGQGAATAGGAEVAAAGVALDRSALEARSAAPDGPGAPPPPAPRAEPLPPSRIAQRIIAALEQGHPRFRGRTWNVSEGNELAGGWLVQSPPAAHWGRRSDALGDGHSDFLYGELFDTIVRARRSVVLATLAAPDEPYVATVRRALARLAAERPDVEVRVLVGLAENGGAQGVLDLLTAELPADSRLRVSVGTYGGAPRSWSHAKIVAVDGEEALVGGHNWWAGAYNGANPVHDVSMRVRGPAARDAERFFDELWGYARSARQIAARGVAVERPAAPPSPPPAGGRSRIISIGATGGMSFNPFSDAAADTAIYAMIDAAERTVRISTPDLVSPPVVRDGREIIPQHLSSALMDHLTQAILRGVRVEIVMSNAEDITNAAAYSWGWTPERTHREMVAHIRAYVARAGPTTAGGPRDAAAVDALIRANLHLAGLRFSDEDRVAGGPLRNHAKVVIADDTVFYIGSQNLYPGGLRDVTITQLAEYGYIVDDPEAVAILIRDYYIPMWRESRRTVVRW